MKNLEHNSDPNGNTTIEHRVQHFEKIISIYLEDHSVYDLSYDFYAAVLNKKAALRKLKKEISCDLKLLECLARNLTGDLA